MKDVTSLAQISSFVQFFNDSQGVKSRDGFNTSFRLKVACAVVAGLHHCYPF
jgi:hypothetical protein